MWVFLNMKPSRRQTLSALMLMFHQVKWVFHNNPRHMDVLDMYGVAQMLFPRMLNLMNDIEDGDETLWFPSMIHRDPFFRSWRLNRPTTPELNTFDDVLHLLKYESVITDGAAFEMWVQQLKIDSQQFDFNKFDPGPVSRFLQPEVTCMQWYKHSLSLTCV